jgi:hypothetical protein
MLRLDSERLWVGDMSKITEVQESFSVDLVQQTGILAFSSNE